MQPECIHLRGSRRQRFAGASLERTSADESQTWSQQPQDEFERIHSRRDAPVIAKPAHTQDDTGTVAAFCASIGNVAVVDCSGTIIATNSNWSQFAREHGARRSKVSLGANYLKVCQAAKARGVREACAALEGLVGVLDGALPEFGLEYRCEASGEELWFEMIVLPLCRPEGGAAITHLSINSRRAAELRALSLAQELAQINRLTVLSKVTSTFAHELAQPLGAIKANAQVVKDILAQSEFNNPTISHALADIATDNLRAAKLIQQFHKMLKKGAPRFQPLRVNSLIRNVFAVVRGVAQLKRIRLVLRLDPELPLIWGDRLQLQQVVLNLVMNAFEAMRHTKVEMREVILETSLMENDKIMICVQDSGPGISANQWEKVFKPFFTTKPKGLGMGLAICRSIVQAHKGEIAIDKNAESGVTFRVILPSSNRGTYDQR